MTAPEHLPGRGVYSAESVDANGGRRDASEIRIGIAVARFNTAATTRLYAGAVHALLEMGAEPQHIVAVHVPGAAELPFAAQQLIEHKGCHAVVALGCVIRGETPHFDHVCAIARDGLLRVQLDRDVPIGFGLLTTDNASQAEERSQEPPGHNVGVDAARAAVELAHLPVR